MMANITGYQDSKRIAAMSLKDAKKMRDSLGIHVEGKHIPRPIMSFEDCSLPDKMLSNLKDNGYIHPRGVQTQAVSAGLYGRDMVISAETGAGKTAGFLIPILVHAYGLSQSPAGALHGPFALILVPTRELATQTEQVAKSIVIGMPNMRTALLVGGQAMANQAHRLKQNIQVAVATPGRMVDIFKQHPEIGFSNVFCLVLDEVDVMFSLGFGAQVKRILEVLPTPPNGRQTIVSSATLSKQIQRLTVKYMENPVTIRIGDSKDQQDGSKVPDVFSPSSKIKQTIMWVENESKKKQLFSLLKDPAYFRPPVLIFVESRVGADLLATAIGAKCPGIKAISMHGEKTQEERLAALKLAKDGAAPVVVATGLLARGLTLNVATVINFDMAPSIEEYVHRVGRASPEAATKAAIGIRKGPKLGGMAWAITFINNDHRSILGDFAAMLHGLGSARVTPLPPQLQHLAIERVGKAAPPDSPSTRSSAGQPALPPASKRKMALKQSRPGSTHSRPDKRPKP
ncbi:DEAD (Asp-Glu-Ala-Asp) box polypeptide 59 [Mortierella alpina]|nr:DEAD (Asp-Glu-Ala-Asp) box polypeptide 59 [Mortierella alpina]